jgi:hypothetical protein
LGCLCVLVFVVGSGGVGFGTLIWGFGVKALEVAWGTKNGKEGKRGGEMVNRKCGLMMDLYTMEGKRRSVRDGN